MCRQGGTLPRAAAAPGCGLSGPRGIGSAQASTVCTSRCCRGSERQTTSQQWTSGSSRDSSSSGAYTLPFVPGTALLTRTLLSGEKKGRRSRSGTTRFVNTASFS